MPNPSPSTGSPLTADFSQRRHQATRNGLTAVYAYLRRADNTPYYVGVSTGKSRVTDQTGHRKHGISVPTDRSRVVFLRGCLTKSQAAQWEQFYIARYGRKDLGTGILQNHSDGGEGMQNPSSETRRRIGLASKGRPVSDKTIAIIRAVGSQPKSEEHRQRIADAQRGRPLKPDHAANVRLAKAAQVAERAAKAGLSVADYKLQLKERAREKERLRKQAHRAAAKQMGMSKRSYDQWLSDGQPSDIAAYLKNGPVAVPGTESLGHLERRKRERLHVGLSERQYRLWVAAGRPADIQHYRTIYGVPGRRPKSALVSAA